MIGDNIETWILKRNDALKVELRSEANSYLLSRMMCLIDLDGTLDSESLRWCMDEAIEYALRVERNREEKRNARV